MRGHKTRELLPRNEKGVSVTRQLCFSHTKTSQDQNTGRENSLQLRNSPQTATALILLLQRLVWGEGWAKERARLG